MTPTRQQIEERLIARSREDKEFRKELLLNPRAVVERELSEMTGEPVHLPDDFHINVHEESERRIHLVLPVSDHDFDPEGSRLILPWHRSFAPEE